MCSSFHCDGDGDGDGDGDAVVCFCFDRVHQMVMALAAIQRCCEDELDRVVLEMVS